jgi:hypothetical protein
MNERIWHGSPLTDRLRAVRQISAGQAEQSDWTEYFRKDRDQEHVSPRAVGLLEGKYRWCRRYVGLT